MVQPPLRRPAASGSFPDGRASARPFNVRESNGHRSLGIPALRKARPSRRLSAVINLPTTNELMVCDLVRFVHRERTGTRTARLRDHVSGSPVAFRAHAARILPVRAGSGPRPDMHVIIRFITCTKSTAALRQARPPIRHPDGPNPAGPPRAGPPALDHR